MGLNNLLDKMATVQTTGGVTPAIPIQHPCALAPADLRTVMEFQQQGITAAFLIYSAVSLGVAPGDHVTVGGATYPVVGVRPFENAAAGPSVFVTVCGPPG